MAETPKKKEDSDIEEDDPDSGISDKVRDHNLYGLSQDEACPYSAFVISPGVYVMRTLGRLTEWNMAPELRPPMDEKPTIHLSLVLPETFYDHLMDLYASQADHAAKDRDDLDMDQLLEPVKGYIPMFMQNGMMFFYSGATSKSFHSNRLSPMEIDKEITSMLLDPMADPDNSSFKGHHSEYKENN
ncbi:hypothetical protein GF345_01820 [Candidatus Woesearchaeota archaeon]|nr:hypothetical protein [Candidatus Woesearchaeota archaeon]